MTDQPQIALVTGASRGIGQAIAHRLANDGFTVIGTATSQNGADNISAAFADKNLTGKGMLLDVNNHEQISEVFAAIQEEYKAMPSILVNNAAITRDNLMLRMKEEEWSQVISTNLDSAFYLSKACLKPMVKARNGRIINITSIVGVTGHAGQANYSAAKAGLIGFTKSLAGEIATRNITVNAIAPGFIDTDMTKALNEQQREAILKQVPMQRLGLSDDIASAVSFLASDQASYITGQTLHVNGGMFMA